MGIEEGAPTLIPQRCGPLRGADDVGEQQGGEDAIDFDLGTLAGQELDDLLDRTSGSPRKSH
jgi:hypothetical protein